MPVTTSSNKYSIVVVNKDVIKLDAKHTNDTYVIQISSGGLGIDAEKIQGFPVLNQAPLGEQVLKFNLTSGKWEPSSQSTITKVAGQILSANKMVVHNDVGKMIYADKDTLSHIFKVYGLTTSSAVVDGNVSIITSGDYSNNTWSWDLTKPIFLSNSGELTQTAPTTGFSIIVGYPVTTTKMFIDIKGPIKLT